MGASQSNISPAQYTPGQALSIRSGVRASRRTPPAVLMASAMKKAVAAGREAYLAGRMPKKVYQASPSSPTSGLIGS